MRRVFRHGARPLLFAALLCPLSATAAPPPPVRGAAVVASDHPVASACGVEVMDKGGNAADAAVASALCAGVVQPAGSGLGGGGFAVVVDGEDTLVLDFREVAPQDATADMFRSPDGGVVEGLSTRTGKAVAVPLESRGLAWLQREHGRLDPMTVARPAYLLAKKGFVVEGHLAKALAGKGASEQVLDEFSDGTREGQWVRRPQLARVIRRWARTGGEDLHTGPSAEQLVAHVQAHDGILTLQDLQGIEPVVREPTVVTFRGYTVHSMPLPSSGGIILQQMLEVLEGFPIDEMDRLGPDYLHLLAETMKHAFADRAQHLGDPAFVDVDVQAILGEARVREIQTKIDFTRTFGPDYYGRPIAPPVDDGTQHISVVDEEGMGVALTTTVNTSFGSGLVPPGLGIVLNNQMDDFVAAPGVPNAFGLVGSEANAIAPGKRPLSSMSPTVLTDAEGEVVAVIGASGGSTIISAVLQVLLNMTVFDMDPQAAVSAPRMHHQWQPDALWLEPEFPTMIADALRARGHEVIVREGFSSAQAVWSEGQGGVAAGADPRKGGRPARLGAPR